jgi:hypothetical protein
MCYFLIIEIRRKGKGGDRFDEEKVNIAFGDIAALSTGLFGPKRSENVVNL